MAEDKQTVVSTIREGLGFLDTAFDNEILTHVNVGSYDLYQVGALNTPVILSTTEWKDIINEPKDLEVAKSYLALHTKLLFDSPQPSIVQTYVKTLERMLDRLHTSNYREKVVEGGD